MNRRFFLPLSKDHAKKTAEFIDASASGLEKTSPFAPAEMFPARPPVAAGLEPYTGPWTMAQVTHLLRRTTFGAPYEAVRHLLGMTMNEAVNSVLQPFVNAPPVPVNDYNNDDYTDPDVPFGQSWVEADWKVEAEGLRIWSLKGWWLRNMIESEATIAEKMVLFWFNHIPVEMQGVFFGRWHYKYYLTLRQHALGNFKSLVKAVTLEPAMLDYLNGQLNSAAQPDENYARELQELFCIGKGPNANFTEEDVRNAARILTGWRVNPLVNDTIFFANWEHDTGDKQFSSFYNNRLIRGRSGQDGMQELDDLLDMIFDQEETALFLCRKLYRFFVYHQIDELTERNIIEPLAQIFRDNQYQVLPVLSVLFRSQHFYDNLNRGAMLKGGLDFLIGMCREFNVRLPGSNHLTDRYNVYSSFTIFSLLLQQFVGDPPNVSGWPAYYQVPQFDKHWVTTDTLPRRVGLADLLLYVGIPTDSQTAMLELIETTRKFPNPADPNALISDALAWLYGIEVSPTVRLILKSILLSGQLSDHYWSDAWNEHIQDPNDNMKRDIVHSRLLGFYYYLLHLEEYQLC